MWERDEGGVGGYNHCDTSEEGEWRHPLLYAHLLGHRLPATLFIARSMRNDMSGDHYEVIDPSPPTPQTPFKGPKCLRGVGVKNCTWAPNMLAIALQMRLDEAAQKWYPFASPSARLFVAASKIVQFMHAGHTPLAQSL